MPNINGLDNEFEFVKYFNRKQVCDLDLRGMSFIKVLFKDISDDTFLTCWRNHYKQKSDIFIKANGVMKGISIKKGVRNSVHVDSISNFTDFLYQSGIPVKIINFYREYHFADGTINGKGKIRQSVEEYKITHNKDIDLMNQYFNMDKMIKLAIERFILQGNNSDFYIDALIYGECNDFLWFTREDIYKVILAQSNYQSSAVHFGPLVVQPKARCLNYNPKYENDRFCVQIKWYSLVDDIKEWFNGPSGNNVDFDTKKRTS